MIKQIQWVRTGKEFSFSGNKLHKQARTKRGGILELWVSQWTNPEINDTLETGEFIYRKGKYRSKI